MRCGILRRPQRGLQVSPLLRLLLLLLRCACVLRWLYAGQVLCKENIHGCLLLLQEVLQSKVNVPGGLQVSHMPGAVKPMSVRQSQWDVAGDAQYTASAKCRACRHQGPQRRTWPASDLCQVPVTRPILATTTEALKVLAKSEAICLPHPPFLLLSNSLLRTGVQLTPARH